VPFLGVVASCGLQTALILWLHPSASYWHQTSFNPMAVALTIAYQTSAGLPLSYFLVDPPRIFPDQAGGALLRWIWDGRVALVALPAFGLSYLSLARKDSASDQAPAGVGWRCFAAMRLILAFFTSLMISMSS
jgi:hypothetical protein